MINYGISEDGIYFMFKVYARNDQMELVCIKGTYGSFRLQQSQLGSKYIWYCLITLSWMVKGGMSPMQVLITHDHVCVPEWSNRACGAICLPFCLFAQLEFIELWLIQICLMTEKSVARKSNTHKKIMPFLCLQISTEWRSSLWRKLLAKIHSISVLDSLLSGTHTEMFMYL